MTNGIEVANKSGKHFHMFAAKILNILTYLTYVALPLGDTPKAGWFLTKSARRVKLFSQPENA